MACSTAAKSSMKVIRSCFAPTSLQYLCCARLRQLLPDCTDTLSVLPLPPGLRHLLHTKLGWVLSLNGWGSEEGADGPECPAASSLGLPSASSPGPPAASSLGPPAACHSLCDSEGCCSNPEAYQRKRCRWT